MLSNLNHLITEYFGDLNQIELNTIASYFYIEKLEKNEFFTKSDKICTKLSFVKSGILRVYTYADGKDITQWISTENYMITDVMGFFFNQPNRWNIQAFTETELLSIDKNSYVELCNKFPRWIEIEKTLMMKCFAMMENRIFSHLSMTAEERYLQYFQYNKDLFNKVPLQYIASLLGMTPETFSRIRKKQI